MLYCPNCKKNISTIRTSRLVVDKTFRIETKRRRRTCGKCGHKWTTFEINRNELEKIVKPVEKNLFFIGELCVRQHKHEGRMKSLRYKSSGNCVECTKGAAGSGG